MILDYILPNRVFFSLKDAIQERRFKAKYYSIIMELNNTERLEEIGIKLNKDGEMFIGVNLNPELLFHEDVNLETVELRLVNEKIRKYTEFFTVEGILDYMKVDYDRVKDDTFYGYILRLSFNSKKYVKSKFIYDISYFSTIGLSIIGTLLAIIL